MADQEEHRYANHNQQDLLNNLESVDFAKVIESLQKLAETEKREESMRALVKLLSDEELPVIEEAVVTLATQKPLDFWNYLKANKLPDIASEKRNRTDQMISDLLAQESETKEPRKQCALLHSLGEIGMSDKRVIARLAQKLRQTPVDRQWESTEEQQVIAANLLGKLPESCNYEYYLDVIRSLVGVPSLSSNGKIRLAAVRSLGELKMTHRFVIESLGNSLNDNDDAVKSWAAIGLVNLLSHKMHEDMKVRAVGILCLGIQSTDQEVRLKIARAFGAIQFPGDTPGTSLLTLLNDVNENVRRQAGRSLTLILEPEEPEER